MLTRLLMAILFGKIENFPIFQPEVKNLFKNSAFLRLCLGLFLCNCCASFILPLIPILSQKLCLSLGNIGLLMSLSALSCNIMQPLYTILLKTSFFRRCNILSIGLFISALFLGGMGFCTAFPALIAVVMLGYLGVGLFQPKAIACIYAMESNKNGEHSQKAYYLELSLLYACGMLGFAIGPLVSTFLVARWGLISSASLFIIGAFSFFSFHNINNACGGSTDYLLQPQAPPLSRRVLPRLTQSDYRLLFQTGYFGVVKAIIFIGLPTFFPLLWSRQGGDISTIGYVLSLSALIGVPFSILGARFCDRYGEKNLLFCSYLPLLLFIPLTFLTSGWVSYTLFILLNGIFSLSLSTNVAIAMKGLPRHPDLVSGLIGGFSYGVGGLFIPFFGWFGDIAGMGWSINSFLLPLAAGIFVIASLPSAKTLAGRIFNVTTPLEFAKRRLKYLASPDLRREQA